MTTKIILFVLLGLVALGTTTEDGTLTPGGSGSQLVESSCDRIQASCIFDDDKLLLRRIAYVESQDGLSPDTYRDGYHGGIWQVCGYSAIHTPKLDALHLSITRGVDTHIRTSWSQS